MLKSPSIITVVLLHVSDVFKFKRLLALMKTICDNMSVVSLVICVTVFLCRCGVNEIVNGVQYQS